MPAPPSLDRRHQLRVLLAPSAYYPHVGGIEEVTRRLAVTLNARGHAASVLTNGWPSGLPAAERLDGVDVRRQAFPLPATSFRAAARFGASFPLAAARLVARLRRERVDVVHAIGAGPQAAYLAALQPLLPGRLVFTAAGELTFDAADVFSHSASLRLGLRMMLRRADVVTACSGYVLDDLQAFAEVAGHAAVVPNAVEVEELAVPRRPAWPPTVLALGRLVPQKGFDVLLDAAADERLDDVRFVVAGDGPLRAALERRAAEAGVAERVSFVGTVTRARVAELFASATVFAFPSRGEGFGIALLEAMAAGVPAVAAATGGIPEFARDGYNALLVPPDDAAALAGALARLLADRWLAQRLSENGRETADGLSWTSIAARYEGLYVAALER